MTNKLICTMNIRLLSCVPKTWMWRRSSRLWSRFAYDWKNNLRRCTRYYNKRMVRNSDVKSINVVSIHFNTCGYRKVSIPNNGIDKVSIYLIMVSIRYRYHHDDKTIVIVISLYKCHYFGSYVRKVDNFMVYEKIIPHFPSHSKFTLKINSDFHLCTYF